MIKLNSISISGKECLPLVEGGKGIAISTGESSGAWAAAGGIGTFSGVNADSYDKDGKLVPQKYKEKTRSGRHKELVKFSVAGAVEQAKIARYSGQKCSYPCKHFVGNGGSRNYFNSNT